MMTLASYIGQLSKSSEINHAFGKIRTDDFANSLLESNSSCNSIILEMLIQD